MSLSLQICIKDTITITNFDFFDIYIRIFDLNYIDVKTFFISVSSSESASVTATCGENTSILPLACQNFMKKVAKHTTFTLISVRDFDMKDIQSPCSKNVYIKIFSMRNTYVISSIPIICSRIYLQSF